MEIKLENVGKKFSNEWIFKNLNFTFQGGKKYALTGFNGSGKSTLLQVTSGLVPSNLGNIQYQIGGRDIPEDTVYKHIYITAPYIELIEEYTLSEAIDFHVKFKPFSNNMSKESFLSLIYMEKEANKLIKQFSSGMKQRLKLGLAFCSESDAIFLDEPTTNLDEQGIQWYLAMVSKLEPTKLVIISSNDDREYGFCDEILEVNDYKVRKS
ncbi:ABC transporter ATP-binding protein [Arcticibacterium luteifluviistationis]|uniref:ABC transporter ATP-binding protein n=1 Tax=Arcticibacterium luteifluviistationis TaxID=1784714 RepID=A0A2Z4GIT3_9BACT|nr:ABC transporter ATP-binding protein [Arcticibacterium luteifluviistationis]